MCKEKADEEDCCKFKCFACAWLCRASWCRTGNLGADGHFSINFLSQLIENLEDGPLKQKLQQIAWYLSHASSGISAGIYHYLMPRALSGYAN